MLINLLNPKYFFKLWQLELLKMELNMSQDL